MQARFVRLATVLRWPPRVVNEAVLHLASVDGEDVAEAALAVWEAAAAAVLAREAALAELVKVRAPSHCPCTNT